MTVIAPYNLSGGRVENYVSLAELKNSVTAASLDFSNLIAGGNQNQQNIALQEAISKASAMVDQYCMGVYGTLCATASVENGRYRVSRDREIIVNPNYVPILEVRSFSVGWGPGANLLSIPLTADNCEIEREQFVITSTGALGLLNGSLSFAGGFNGPGSRVFVQYEYVSGWANSFLSAGSLAGASSIAVVDSTGFYPGQFFTIWDAPNDEYCQVRSVSGNTITTQNPTLYAHGAGVNASTLPQTVKQACIHFVVGIVKQRGAGGLVIGDAGEPVAVTARTETSMEDMVLAYDLLDDFKAQWSRS